ncbi:putative DNA repair protein [Cercophora samala]|uniref:DNA repair protein n=1 Tax=Cercophora samala TaxID=330535 RepID=A0AA40DDA4_9PEZI|nr:putative DNA repair protein [Cercophora samala]
MPPYIPLKRLRSPSPLPTPEPKKRQPSTSKKPIPIAPPRKPTLFDDLDASSTTRSSTKTSLLEIEDSEDDSSSLTSLSDADFEDVPLDGPSAKRRKLSKPSPEQTSSEDEDIEFEDVPTPLAPAADVAIPTDDLDLTLVRDNRISLTAALGKKGPSKIERRIRIAAHCVHVQLLLWHNALRNAWCSDEEVMAVMISHLSPRLWEEVDRWRRSSGLEVQQEEPPRGKTAGKGKGKGKATEKGRDWGAAAKHLEKGAVDMSHGDPLFRLMKVLTSWWKQRFRVTAPGLRKQGYMSLERLDRITKAYKQTNGDDQDRFGEKIDGLEGFRQCAHSCTGSRDVGAQLFTALLRGLGIEARLVASLQPLGFGWNKLEEADPEKEEHYLSDNIPSAIPIPDTKPRPPPPKTEKAPPKPTPKTTTRSTRQSQKPPADPSSDLESLSDSSNDLIIPPSPSPPPSTSPTKTPKPKPYDLDLEYPHYWTEALSPVTQKFLSIDPLKPLLATNPDLLSHFEPRGSKADKARQVVSYIIAHSPDGTAKDVTIRYLKRQQLPGRTKGNRLPPEKIPVYDKNGKVKRHEEYDWFKRVMNAYVRGRDQKHPLTEADTLENETDLKPAERVEKVVKEGEETLQYYKQSKEFVLERHLKREEALLPGAKPVKMFVQNRSKKPGGTNAQGEPVYSRKDVVQVKSAETWHKQGRAPKPGEEPLKRVPYRAATTNRRREIAEAEMATGQKVLQGLYSHGQTDWIIPPPIQDGKIPKNEYGNIDLFVPTMCPEGAVHVPYRGAGRVAKRLGIDYAEAVVDFEFGHRMAVPVVQGVVVAEEFYGRMVEELERDEAERRRKEDEKRRKRALGVWRRMLMGLRIVERLEGQYGGVKGEEGHVFGKGGAGGGGEDVHMAGGFEADGDQMAGGFLPEGHDIEDEGMGGGFLPEADGMGGGGFFAEGQEEDEHHGRTTSGYFPTVQSDDDDDDDGDGEDVLEIDHGDVSDVLSEAVSQRPASPSLSPPPEMEETKAPLRRSGRRKALVKPKAAASRRKRGARRRNVGSTSSEEEEIEDGYEDPDSGDDE